MQESSLVLIAQLVEHKRAKLLGRGFNSRSGHSSFYFCKKDFTLALVLKLPGEMPIQSQRTLSFSATQEVSKTLIKNQMTLYTSLPTNVLWFKTNQPQPQGSLGKCSHILASSTLSAFEYSHLYVINEFLTN